MFLETYTSGTINNLLLELTRALGIEILRIDRSEVEEGSLILEACAKGDVAFLVQGDALTATTHNQLRFEAKSRHIPIDVIENASIITVAMGLTGLQMYKLGPVVSLPYTSEHFFPRSPYDKIMNAVKSGQHCMILLDLNSEKFMTPTEAISTLEELDRRYGPGLSLHDRKIIVVHSVSTPQQRILYGPARSISRVELSSGPSTLILPGPLDDNEQRFLGSFAETFD